MTENEAISAIQNDLEWHSKELKPKYKKVLEYAIQALEEIQQYRAMEQRLQNIYGECDGLLETVVQHLENHENIKLPDNIIKARLLTDEDVDKWEGYRAIGTVGEFKALKEKAEAKKPILNNPKIDEFYVKEAKLCPSCHSYINDCSGDYCRDCGQAIDWSE